MFKTSQYYSNPSECPSQEVQDLEITNPVWLYDGSWWIECVPQKCGITCYYTIMGSLEFLSTELEQAEEWLYNATEGERD